MDKKMSIMIVDDEEIVRKSLFHWFKKYGHVVEIASSGFEALEKLVKYPFQLLFVYLILYLPVPTTSELAKVFLLGPLLLISTGIAIPLLYFGIKKLSKTE